MPIDDLDHMLLYRQELDLSFFSFFQFFISKSYNNCGDFFPLSAAIQIC